MFSGWRGSKHSTDGCFTSASAQSSPAPVTLKLYIFIYFTVLLKKKITWGKNNNLTTTGVATFQPVEFLPLCMHVSVIPSSNVVNTKIIIGSSHCVLLFFFPFSFSSLGKQSTFLHHCPQQQLHPVLEFKTYHISINVIGITFLL